MHNRLSGFLKLGKKKKNGTVTSVSPQPATSVPTPASSSTPVQTYTEHRAAILSSIRTVLNLAEKCCDGWQLYGPKAIVSAVSEGIDIVQTTFENEQSIESIVTDVQETAAALASSMTSLSTATSVSAELRSRISSHTSKLESIGASTAKWTKQEKKMWKRLLDARRVAENLEDVMKDIHKANERFLMETAVRTEVKVEQIQEGLGAITQSMVDSNVTTARTETKIESLQGGIGAFRQNIVDEKDRALLECLRPVTAAFHDARNAPSSCMEGTRQQLIADIFAWFNNPDPSGECVFWLNGLAGTGKSAVARTIADRAQDQGRLAATFFFSRNSAETREPSAIIPTIAYQLAVCLPSIRVPICAALDSDRHVRDRGVVAQARILLNNISTAVASGGPFLVVLDALDECHLENGRQGGDAVPQLLEKFGSLGHIRFLITSRVEAPIQRMLTSVRSRVALHDIEKDIVQTDIHHYLERSFTQLARDQDLELPFPRIDQLDELVRRAGSLFIYAATVAKWISDPGDHPMLRLQQVLEKDEDELSYQHQFLDNMYTEILAQAAKTSRNPVRHESALKNVVSTVVLLQAPVRASALAILAGEEMRTAALLPLLSAVLLVDEPAPVRLFHPSFPEFVTSDERCRDERFVLKTAEGHLHLANRCLDVMNIHLQENICNIKDPSLPNTEVHLLQHTLEGVAPAELRYACRYWHAHLRLAEVTSSSLVVSLETFCTTHLLHWLELLSLLSELPTAHTGMPLLLACLRSHPERVQPSLVDLLADIQQLLSDYHAAIEGNALHVYHSAAVTMPVCPLWEGQAPKGAGLPRLRTPRAQGWILHGLILEGHTDDVISVAFSPGGQFIVSGSADMTVRVWDTAAGTERHVMHGHESYVTSVAFSPSSQFIVSGSGDWTVRVWDASTGKEQRTMGGHEGPVWSIAFSPDGQTIVSGSDDKTVRVWNAATGTERHIMHGHKTCVSSVAFSPNGQSIVSGSKEVVHVWDASTGTEQHVMQGHISLVTSVAFSPDGQSIVSGSWDKMVRVWDATTGTERHTMHGHEDEVHSVAFSPDGQSIVSGSGDKTVRVWDVATGTERHIIHGHQDYVRSVAFSLDSQSIVSGSDDKTVRVWDSSKGTEQHIMHGHRAHINYVAFSPNGQFIVSGSSDETVRVWDATTGTERYIMQGHDGDVNSVAFSPNGQSIVSGSNDKTARVWDATTGTERYILHGHDGPVFSVDFSSNGQSIVSGSDDRTVRVWDAATGMERHTIHGHQGCIRSAAFSPNGQFIVSGSQDRTVRVWDATTGMEQHTMHGHESGVNSVAFSPNGQSIVSGSDDKTVRVWDAIAGIEHHSMYGHEDWVLSVAFTPGGHSIVSRSRESAVRVWDASTGLERYNAADPDSPFFTRAPGAIVAFEADTIGWVWRVAANGNWQQLCWLPKQYRGSGHEIASHGQTVCIGADNGAITILDFSDVPFSSE